MKGILINKPKVFLDYLWLVPLILITSCDLTDTTVIAEGGNLEINTSAQLAAVEQTASSKVSFDQNMFSVEKQRKIVEIITSSHYTSPKYSTVKRVVGNPTQLDQYFGTLDPYSNYLSATQSQFFRERHNLNRLGIGFNLLIEGSDVLLVPIKNTPLYNSGLKQPRYLVSLDARTIKFDDFSSYSFLNSMKQGEELRVIVNNPNKARKSAYRPRIEKYQRQLISYKEEKQYAIIKISEFRESGRKVLSKYLKKAVARKKRVVLDLRFNPGGDLFATVDMLSLFIKENIPVAYLQKNNGHNLTSLDTSYSKYHFTQPFHLFISKFTASSAETFVSAIKHYVKNSTTIGEATKGKCLAQETHPLTDGSSITVSAYKILTPDKKHCHLSGIIPDSEIIDVELLSIDRVLKILHRL